MADRTVRVRLEAAVAGFNSAMNQAAANTRSSSQKIQGSIRANRDELQTMGVAAGAAGVAAAAGIASVMSSGMDFQASMQQVAAVSGATGDQFDALSEQARELGASTRFSASEAAEGMGFLAMAGFDASQTMAAMPGVLELAAAGAMDLGTAADIASNVLTGFGLAAGEVGRVNDVMAATFTTTNTDLRQLGEAMKFVAPVAMSAGIELEAVAAAIGLMGNAGIQGSMAGTSLRGAITRLLTPSKEAADILARLGINATEADGSLVSLDQIVGQLETSGANTAEMMTIFGQRAGPAMAALVSQGADALRDQTVVALESAGTAASIAEIQMEGLKGSLTELGSATEGLKIALFESGAGDAAEGAVDTLTGLVQVLEGLPDPVQATAMGMGALTAVVGTVSGAALIAAPRIVDTADAVRKLGGVSGMARGGLAGLVRFGLHPATIAIGAGITAVGLYAKAKQDARNRVQEFTDAVIADSGAIGDNTRAHVVNRLEVEGALTAAATLGINLATVTDAAMGNTTAMRGVGVAVQDAFDARNVAGAGNVTQELAVNAEAAARLQGVLETLHPEMAEGVDAGRRYAEAMAETEGRFLDVAHAIESGVDPSLANTMHNMGLLGVASDTVGTGLADLGEDFEDLGGEIDEAAVSLANYITAMQEATDPVLALRGALDRQLDAQEKLNDVMGDAEATTRDREAALWDMFEADRNVQIAALQAGEAVGGFDDILEDWIVAAGLSAEEAEIVRASFADVQTQADATAGDYEIRLLVEAEAGMNIIDRLRSELGRIPTEVVTRWRAQGTQVAGVTSSGGFTQHDGGWAGTGPLSSGPPKADEVDARLQVGEFVLSRDMLAGRSPIPLFHNGGEVGARSAVTARGSSRGMGGGMVHVTLEVPVNGRVIARDEAFVDALTGEVNRRARNTATAGL